MSTTHDLRDFLSRSTESTFEETTLWSVLSWLPPLAPFGPWLAGGALRRTLLGKQPASDFDFFFRDADQLQAFEDRVIASGLTKVRETEHHKHYRGTLGEDPTPRDIQMIRFAFYADAAAVIDSFDFTICQFAYDGQALTVGDFSLWDLGRKRLAVHKITYPVSSMRRMLKYGQQGFTVCTGAMQALLVQSVALPELKLEIAYVD
jgi:hypothetical protein